MFTVGMPIAGELYFMYATMLIAVPTGVKVFNWITTMYKGCLTFEAPMLFSIAFVILFTFGGFTGLMLSIAAADIRYHDTYFVVCSLPLCNGRWCGIWWYSSGLLLVAKVVRKDVQRNHG